MKSIKTLIKKPLRPIINKLPPKLTNNLPIGLPDKSLQWSIGIYVGKSLFDLSSANLQKNPVLTRQDVSDVRAGFVADPFMLQVEHTWYMFFEVFNSRTCKGEIGLATSQNTVNWQYRQIVLAEPFHLSYPYVFQWMNEYYMIPETYQANSVKLYKASKFPAQWTFVGNILTGSVFLDASIFRYADKWWLFTETNPEHRWDTLRLYYADDLLGPWIEHPNSPIVSGNAHIARPAGRVLVMKDTIIRYTQDCDPEYGIQVRAFEIDDLSPTTYHEREISQNPILEPSNTGWNGSGMHHIDPHLVDDGHWIACVDGRIR
ncbi:hypothetical protein ACF3DV_09305 [Chlorogloeopsis fritschii PCC 9212]|uniref:Glucosamine inositolphosphorylceramide transferase 1 N-terminal domain-containing protein n=1 Tax=Chlorogloeopsis fritschii PCC 6912 TaxID=211165 RepID=A0A433NNS6_CHLFR|nr:hypothetical protein [Chlorogloeopsis fritschii]MBF2004714.1 hypothetical protein [Chlorogloeopsis fritschii C42_A2020_084]RUR84983.1 hypothetical protein PCC6912_10990 [Chlorogloeopsis fritschii PCC 6912]